MKEQFYYRVLTDVDAFKEESTNCFLELASSKGWFETYNNGTNLDVLKRHENCFKSYLDMTLDDNFECDIEIESPYFYASDYVTNMRVKLFEDVINEENEKLKGYQEYKNGEIDDCDIIINNYAEHERIYIIDNVNKIIAFH